MPGIMSGKALSSACAETHADDRVNVRERLAGTALINAPERLAGTALINAWERLTGTALINAMERGFGAA